MSELSPIETVLLRLILEGKSNEEIASEIHWENDAHLRNTISRMMNKLDISNPRQLIPRAPELRKLVVRSEKNGTL